MIHKWVKDESQTIDVPGRARLETGLPETRSSSPDKKGSYEVECQILLAHAALADNVRSSWAWAKHKALAKLKPNAVSGWQGRRSNSFAECERDGILMHRSRSTMVRRSRPQTRAR